MENKQNDKFKIKSLNREIIVVLIFLLLILIITRANLMILHNFVDIVCTIYAYNIVAIITKRNKNISKTLFSIVAIIYTVFALIGLINLIDNNIINISIYPFANELKKNVEFIGQYGGYIFSLFLLVLFLATNKFEESDNRKLHIIILINTVNMISAEVWLYLNYNKYTPINIFTNVILLLTYYKIYNMLVDFGIEKPYGSLCEDVNNLNKELISKNIELKESIQRYKTVIDLTPNSIIISENGKCIFANNSALTILKAKNVEEVIGKEFLDFIHNDNREVVKERIKATKESGTICPFIEQKYVALDGTITHVKATGTSIPYDSNIIISIARDITESKKAEKSEKRLEEALQYDKLRKDFFANLSHELRTPLNVIFTAVQMLQIKLRQIEHADESIIKYITMTEQNCYRLLKIINNLIDITKIDSGYFNVNMENFDIVRLVEDTTLSIAEYIESKKIELIFDTDIEEKIIACDEEKISRVIINLLSNAVKFTKPGGKIMVNVYDKGEDIIIRVKDTGVGITKSMHKIIFERFTQVNKNLARDFQGSGIGLSIVKALVDMHNGEVWVESEVGNGSSFFIKLPAIKVEDGKPVRNYNFVKDQKNVVNIEFSDIIK
jgi:PAS domain S-box-containing protein